MNKCQFFFILVQCIIFLALCVHSTTQNADCLTSTFVTVQTQCEIKFQICGQLPSQQSKKGNGVQFKSELQYINNPISDNKRFVSCKRRKCLRQLINGECKFQQYFDLNQQICFHQCCGISNQFSSDYCMQYNRDFGSRQQAINTFLIVFLSISITILLIVFFTFLACKIKCWRNKQNHIEIITEVSKKKWKKVNGFEMGGFNKCQFCKKDQANIQTDCHHWYHMNCLQPQMLNQQCPRCLRQLKFTNLKFYCQCCWDKYLSISFKGVSHFKSVVEQLISEHAQQCMKRDLPSTDVRLTYGSGH